MGRSVGRVAVVVAIPLVLVGNGLWLLASEWFVELLYALGAAGADPIGLTESGRLELARAGVESIRPAGDGTGALEAARMPGGEAAFTADEIAHMADVRGLVRAFVLAWAVALAALVGGGALLARSAGAFDLARAAAAGAGLTVAIMAVLGGLMLVAFDVFFVEFHKLFFAEGTWRFPPGSTLLALFPYSFWTASGAAMAGLVLLQAVGLGVAGVRLGRGRRARVALGA